MTLKISKSSEFFPLDTPLSIKGWESMLDLTNLDISGYVFNITRKTYKFEISNPIEMKGNRCFLEKRINPH